MQTDLVTPEELAKQYGVAVSTVRAWVREGRVPCLRPSRRVIRFRPSDVESALSCKAADGGRTDE